MFCHEIREGFELLVITRHPLSHHLNWPFRYRDWVPVLHAWVTGFLWGPESSGLGSSLLLASCGQSSLGSCSLLRCFQGARLRSPCSGSYKPSFTCNPRESLSSLPGALPCIMLLPGQSLQALASSLLIYSNPDGFINPKPIALQPKLLSLFL